MLKQYRVEAWKTNVLGTLYVLEAARVAAVEKFVNISTDKAANPTSVLSRSKHIRERLVAAASDNAPGTHRGGKQGSPTDHPGDPQHTRPTGSDAR